MTLGQVREEAARLLPGCTVRRLLFWRYLLVFRRPQDARHRRGAAVVYMVTPSRRRPVEHHDDDFERFYAAAFGRIAGQLFVVTGDLQEAEDMTQEAFARASVRWSRLRTYDLPEAWVRRVALRLATDRFRQARRRLAALRRLDPEPRMPAVSVEALALAEELRALPLGWRKAIVLHHLVGMPVEEAARTLGVPAGTVKTWLARGRRALAARLGDEQGAVRRD